MFLPIFRYELTYWFRNPSVYMYAAIMLAMATMIMAASAGIFGEGSSSGSIANSPMNIYALTIFFNKLLLILLPSIIGNAVYRDFRHNAHAVLYSYPINKMAYLSGKFLSGYVVVCFINLAIGAGFFIGTHLPGINNLLVSPFELKPYVTIYLIYLFPNMLFFGTLVFAVVVVTRNIYAGFISIIILLIAREILGRLTGANDSDLVAQLLEPFGESAANFYISGLTVAEQEEISIPFGPAIIYNRLFWLSITFLFLGLLLRMFSFNTHSTFFQPGKKTRKRDTKNNFRGTVTMTLSKVNLRFTFFQQLKICWKLSNLDFKFIMSSRSFIIALLCGTLFVFLLLFQMNPQYETRILPVTWVMLAFPVFFFSLFINFMTFLYAGVLVHRAKISGINELADVTPVHNWAFALSKLIALIKMQVLLLSVVMISGIVVQASNSYYQFEIHHYLFDLFIIHLAGFIIWTFAAIFIQIFFTSPYPGLFFLVLFSFGMSELPHFGIAQVVFRFNQNPEPDFFLKYSDLSGYGHSLIPYFIYKIYWGLFGLTLFFCTFLFWPRELTQSFRERWRIVKSRFKSGAAVGIISFTVLFLTMGSWLLSEENKPGKLLTETEAGKVVAAADMKYAALTRTVQPRIVKVSVHMDIFPESRSFKAMGVYFLENKSNQMIDTLLINYGLDVRTQYRINSEYKSLNRDTAAHFDILYLSKGLAPGDTLQLRFDVENIPNTLLHKNSMVEKDGTFITSVVFPGLGYRLSNSGYSVSDSAALQNHYRSIDADYIDFEATVSTSEEQIAIAPGYLQKEWIEEGRKYFHYKSEGKVTNDYVFNSGRFEVAKSIWKGINLEIYYHKGHAYNLDHFFKGLTASLAYNERFFGPYQHRQARIIEYSRAQGNFAQSFANTIPYSEVGFIMDVGATPSGLDLPFLGAAHEMAHQWWGMQVIPADVPGCRMITESMAEYVSLKVLQQEYSQDEVRLFLKKSSGIYLSRRVDEEEVEKPLMYNTGLSHSYIPYQKGSLAMYAMSECIGEERLNQALKTYLEAVKFQHAPYTTSTEMVDHIRAFTPDSLQYLITDLFETVTLYDNKIVSSKVKLLSNGKYRIEIEFLVIKYRMDETGKKVYRDMNGKLISYKGSESATPLISLPLADYIEIGVSTKNGIGKGMEDEYILKKIRVTEIHNKLTIIVNNRPSELTIDPHMKLIDATPNDNAEIL